MNPDAPAPAIACRGLHRHLGTGDGRVHVLRGVDFAAEPGRVCAVVGPSGCGKSTLLYSLGLLDRPDSGEVWIGGHNLGGADDAARTAARCAHIGFVFQFHFLLPEFTALENVMLPMRKLGRRTPPEMAVRARELLDEVGLGDKTHRRPGQLSGGEQQRVAVARALANDPAVLLADEPTGNLDQRNSTQVFELLGRLARSHGRAVVLVTHNPEIARGCDDVRAMCDGVFVEAGKPGSLLV